MQCPNCKNKLAIEPHAARCEPCATTYPEVSGIWCLLPRDMPAWKRDEAYYHTEFEHDPAEVHQLDRFRNRFAHALVHDAIGRLPKGSRVLEVGEGIGRDTAVLAEDGYQVMETDISLGALKQSRKTTSRVEVKYVAADGDVLPFGDGAFDAVFLIAALHHLPDPITCVREMARVARPGGLVIAGVEPNRTWHALIRAARPLLCAATDTALHGGSTADEALTGFKKSDLLHAFASCGIAVEAVHPVWFATGFLHYGIEFAYRGLGLHRRIKTPDWLDKIFLAFDRAIFSVPGLDRLAWHWTVIGKKL